MSDRCSAPAPLTDVAVCSVMTTQVVRSVLCNQHTGTGWSLRALLYGLRSLGVSPLERH